LRIGIRNFLQPHNLKTKDLILKVNIKMNFFIFNNERIKEYTMRLTYKNPKELATALKDLIDSYLDDLIEYDKLEERVTKFVAANEDRVYKDGVMSLKVANVLGDSRVEIVEKIMGK
jgi:uncharacterized protein (TIGR04540 family)